MQRRTVAQIALLVIGMIVWGYAQRTDDSRLSMVGIAFFAVAFVLRFAKRREADIAVSGDDDPGQDG